MATKSRSMGSEESTPGAGPMANRLVGKPSIRCIVDVAPTRSTSPTMKYDSVHGPSQILATAKQEVRPRTMCSSWTAIH